MKLNIEKKLYSLSALSQSLDNKDKSFLLNSNILDSSKEDSSRYFMEQGMSYINSGLFSEAALQFSRALKYQTEKLNAILNSKIFSISKEKSYQKLVNEIVREINTLQLAPSELELLVQSHYAENKKILSCFKGLTQGLSCFLINISLYQNGSIVKKQKLLKIFTRVYLYVL